MSFHSRFIRLEIILPRTRRCFSSSRPVRRINKLCNSATEAVGDMCGGTTLLVGGFGFSGVPDTLINALRDRPDLTDFTVVSNNAGMPGVGLGIVPKLEIFKDLAKTNSCTAGQLLETKQISKMIASYIGENKVFEKMYLSGQLSLELCPQGTIAEKCAAGAAGVPAFFTPAGYGTVGTEP